MILLNGKEINVTMFPDKTSQVWKIDESELVDGDYCDVTWLFENESEFMHLAQLKMLLDTYHLSSTLIMPYLPYARQDKPVSNTSCFALHSFALLLNRLKFSCVRCVDPHSGMSLKLIDNLQLDAPLNIKKAKQLGEKICYPDKGAYHRYAVSKETVIVMNKTRDPITGNITGLICDPQDLSGQTICIVDDICDGGKTFVECAKILYNMGAKEVNVSVSHGIFSKGMNYLFENGIKRIYVGAKDELHSNPSLRFL